MRIPVGLQQIEKIAVDFDFVIDTGSVQKERPLQHHVVLG